LLDGATRQRWKQLVKIKKRRDLLHDDVDFESFDPQLIQVLESRAADSRRLLAALVRLGARDRCAIIAVGHGTEPWEAPLERRSKHC